MYMVDKLQKDLDVLDAEKHRVHNYSTCSITEDVKYFDGARSFS
jgi:hypothetical protein